MLSQIIWWKNQQRAIIPSKLVIEKTPYFKIIYTIRVFIPEYLSKIDQLVKEELRSQRIKRKNQQKAIIQSNLVAAKIPVFKIIYTIRVFICENLSKIYHSFKTSSITKYIHEKSTKGHYFFKFGRNKNFCLHNHLHNKTVHPYKFE